ncbi:MAG TPA: hypothetical protein VLE48_09785 [Terriglobales bacterium]|jgi:hypothetical protein|nr:hypothetical protein [Terriglobales bacterium]
MENAQKPVSPPDPLEEMGRKVGRELGEIVNYLNNEVVPKVRNQSSGGLRTAAQKLIELADYMDRNRR